MHNLRPYLLQMFCREPAPALELPGGIAQNVELIGAPVPVSDRRIVLRKKGIKLPEREVVQNATIDMYTEALGAAALERKAQAERAFASEIDIRYSLFLWRIEHADYHCAIQFAKRAGNFCVSGAKPYLYGSGGLSLSDYLSSPQGLAKVCVFSRAADLRNYYDAPERAAGQCVEPVSNGNAHMHFEQFFRKQVEEMAKGAGARGVILSPIRIVGRRAISPAPEGEFLLAASYLV